ncbi:helix-turn-helix domain-containing protein [Nocardia niigatensis]
MPRPLERLVAKLGEHLVGDAPRKKLVHRLAPARPEPRSYKPNRKLSPDEIQKLIARYDGGASIAELAREFGMHTQTVDAHLKRQGVEKRSLRKMSDEQVERAVQLYGDGWSTTDLAEEFQVAAPTVRMTIIRAGVKLRGQVEGRWYTTRKTSRCKKKN